MVFQTPWLLPLLILVPLLVGAYVWMLRRRRRYAVRYSSLALIREALPASARWRRHLPFAFFLLGITGLIIAAARPAAEVEVPLSRSTIVLAMDVSRSMCATDVAPNRLTVAQDAALAFIAERDAGTQIGLVAFADFAEIIVPPTTDKEQLRQAIVSFTTAFGTAIGSATLKSVDAIADVNPNVPRSGLNLQLDEQGGPLPPDVYEPEIIVLLTDGANSRGPRPIDAAQQAADRRIRIYTIGFGTTDPGSLECTREQLGSDYIDIGPPGGAFRRFVVLDEATLRAMAEMTGGVYFAAENAGQLVQVFRDLPSVVTLQKERIEISALFSTLGGLLAMIGVGLSLWWNRVV